MSNLVYEMEKGFSFDGGYIPHFLELNWFFGDNPVDFTGLRKVRVHGVSKGSVNMQVSANGLTTDDMDYDEHYSDPQELNLPRNIVYTSDEYKSVTNTTDLAARGLSVQLKFEGIPKQIDIDNGGGTTTIDAPEPSHVLQVLVLQTTDTGARSN